MTHSRSTVVRFLLLLAIADDALGLVILALFYPSGPLSIRALLVLMSAALSLRSGSDDGQSAASGRTW